MAGLSELIQLIDAKIFENATGEVTATDMRDVLIALVTAGLQSPEDLIDLIQEKLPDNTAGAIDADELRDAFIALASALSLGAGGGSVIATRVTVCFRIMMPEGVDVSFLETIPVFTPKTIDDLIDMLPGNQSRLTCEVYRGQARVEPLVSEYTALREGPENIYITYYQYEDAGTIIENSAQALAYATAAYNLINPTPPIA